MMVTEIVPTREITTILEKIFLVFLSMAVGLFRELVQCCSINSTDYAQCSSRLILRLVHSTKPARYVRSMQLNTDRRTCGHS